MNLASSRLSALQSVPQLSLSSFSGTAIRHCDEHKGWLPPNLFNCTSVSFSKLKALVCSFTHCHIEITTHTTGKDVGEQIRGCKQIYCTLCDKNTFICTVSERDPHQKNFLKKRGHLKLGVAATSHSHQMNNKYQLPN